jgi:hypothetical protein
MYAQCASMDLLVSVQALAPLRSLATLGSGNRLLARNAVAFGRCIRGCLKKNDGHASAAQPATPAAPAAPAAPAVPAARATVTFQLAAQKPAVPVVVAAQALSGSAAATGQPTPTAAAPMAAEPLPRVAAASSPEPPRAAAPAEGQQPTSTTHRPQWMAFQRACQNPHRTPPAWAAAYKNGGASRAALFAKFVEHNGDIESVELEMRRSRTSTTQQRVKKEYLTKQELLDKFKDQSVVDQIIHQKRLAGVASRDPVSCWYGALTAVLVSIVHSAHIQVAINRRPTPRPAERGGLAPMLRYHKHALGLFCESTRTHRMVCRGAVAAQQCVGETGDQGRVRTPRPMRRTST